MSAAQPTTPTATGPSTPPQATTPDADPAVPPPAGATNPSTPPRQTLPSSATVERTRQREDTPIRLPPQSIGKPPKTPDFRSVLQSARSSKGNGKLGTSTNSVPKSAPPGLRSRRFGGIGQGYTTQGARPAPSPFMFGGTTSAPSNAKKPGIDTEEHGTEEDIAAKIGVVQWDSSDEEESKPKLGSKSKK
ncbi:hypothetical protein TWF696_005394 [Orbilia brochopaga]|uniref:Uncharacterized protein n=1 Tax=Orbilia brochopaga TaxID=3140254 RepID=A0AAV9V774_9PEZI